MINAGRSACAVGGEGFSLNGAAAAHLGIGVGETPARDADPKIGLRAQELADAQLRVQVHGGHRQSQSEIGPDKPWEIEVVKGVGRERAVALQREVVSELDQLSFARIDLGMADRYAPR